MKCPTLIAAIARDLEDGHACILQIVSTNEALLDRRLAEIPTSEWADLSIDITPREYVLDYLSHSFPTQLFELYTDDEGNLCSRPAYDADGNPVISREAVERRDRMIEHLASLPPVQGALDQILHRFGTDLVAEVTGRSRRIVKPRVTASASRPAPPRRILPRPPPSWMTTSASWSSPMPAAPGAAITPISAARTSAGASITCWSPAGAPMRRSRDWAAPTAPTRSSRRCSVRSRPTSRARSAFCRRSRGVSTRSGAITRGQRQTGGQGLFRADDNLESPYAKAALRQFYQLLYAGKIEGCSLTISRTRPASISSTRTARLREELPPITQFLNRILALRIAMQNTLFAAFEQLLDARIEAAIAAGTYDIGVETLTAESFQIAERRTVYTHAATGAETRCYRVLRKDRNRPLPLAEALGLRARSRRPTADQRADRSRAAVQMHAAEPDGR